MTGVPDRTAFRVVSALIPIAIAACLASAPAVAQGAAKARLAVTLPPTAYVQGAALDAAQRMGAFAKEGLSVSVTRQISTANAIKAVAEGKAHLALVGPQVLRSIALSGVPVRVIASVSTRMPYVIYAKKDAGITAISDLKGKTIHSSRARRPLDIMWSQMLAGAGLAGTDVKRIAAFDGLKLIGAGKVDAAVLHSTQIDKARGANLVRIEDFNGWRKERLLGNEQGGHLSWVAGRKWVASRGDTAKRFLRALVKATVRLRSDRAFAVEVLRAKPYGLSEISAHQVYDLHHPHWIVRLDRGKNDLAFDLSAAEVALGRAPGTITLNRVGTPALIADVLAELEVVF